MGFRRRKGRVLAVKLGLNPNSSSLGVDVTFLLAGAAVFSLATPVLSALVRWRAAARAPAGTGDLGDLEPADIRVAGDRGDAGDDGAADDSPRT